MDIQDAINALTTQGNNAVTTPPSATIAPLNYSAPSVGDVSSQYTTFLNEAANNPDLINYYSQLIEQANGDINIAISQLENDYQTGVRNTTENLQANLQQLGLTFENESNQLQNTLAQRGIGVTQSAPGNAGLTYGGGESGYEQGQLAQSQTLRQEAEQRTASQNITSLQNTLNKGLTSQGQQAAQFGLNTKQAYEGNVSSLANTYMNLYTQGQQAQINQASMNQKTQTAAQNAKGATATA